RSFHRSSPTTLRPHPSRGRPAPPHPPPPTSGRRPDRKRVRSAARSWHAVRLDAAPETRFAFFRAADGNKAREAHSVNREEPEKAVEECGPEDGIPYGQSVIVRSRSMFPHVPFRHLLRVPFSALVR